MNCPACQLGPEFQVDDKEEMVRSQCKGCGTKFFNKEKVFK